MGLSDQALWDRITNFSIDEEGAVLPFSKRLARENKWSYAFTLNAIKEYKRFIYLTCISPTPLTPSEEVDKVWHLHLTYTRNYWDEFCKQTLERSIHHTPTNGGTIEQGKFHQLYEQTQIVYEHEFGRKAPTRFWPHAKKRFSLNTIARLGSIQFSKIKIAVASILGLVVLAGCTVNENSISQLFGNENWWWWLIGAVVVLVIFFGKKGDSGGGDGCSGCGGD